MSESKRDCIVVRTACCKRLIYAAVNEPRVMQEDRVREIGQMVIEGCAVEHMTAEDVRKADFGCKCNEPAVKSDFSISAEGRGMG